MIDSKRKAIVFLTISFILAIVTAGVVLVQISQAQDRLGEMVEVASVGTNVESYTEINPEDIEWVKFPRTNAYSSFITDAKDLEDVISIVNLESGDILTKSLVRKKLDIPANERVVWLNATDIVLIDQQVAEGDLVDVIVSREIEKNVETKRLLSNVKVVQIEKGIENTESIKISLPISEAEQLIHYQNFAKQIRVLRVNQVGDEAISNEKSNPIVEEKPVEKDEEKKKTVTDVEVEKSKDEKKKVEKDKDE
ncbi:hypothetical protein SLU01_14910 [Sporosarcina luteola]|uniref:SAF domain-containing protein n=1 Tax=Sporosarcina luteola TaxID=582850 RepID=A0A511Z6W1_9BACL|nr:hypothetical protein [Sporosarcina luteola]GEN83179.1 hypothetical protein SLU01_14910 [Sporosarcina luteola]